jgi:hypothetical protein
MITRQHETVRAARQAQQLMLQLGLSVRARARGLWRDASGDLVFAGADGCPILDLGRGVWATAVVDGTRCLIEPIHELQRPEGRGVVVLEGRDT